MPFPPQRYTSLLEKSPFAIASAPPEPVPVSTENFATNWILTGISKQRGQEGKERFTVFVRSRDLATRLVLTADQPNDDGVSLVSVEEASIPAKSVAFLKKGNETGRVEFDQATVAAATPPPTAPGRAGAKAPSPGAPGKTLPNRTSTPVPRPGQTPIPRPGGVPAQPGSSPSTGTPPSQEPRRRIRPIQDAPSTPMPPPATSPSAAIPVPEPP